MVTLTQRGKVRIAAGAAVLAVTATAWAQAPATMDPNSPSIKNVQSLITKLKNGSTNVQEISVHAITSTDKVNIVASTNNDLNGKPSSDKDVEALQSGTLSIRNNDGVYDIKVPLKAGTGQSIAAAGVKLADQGGLSIPKAKEQAADIASQIEQALAAAP